MFIYMEQTEKVILWRWKYCTYKNMLKGICITVLAESPLFVTEFASSAKDVQ